MGDSGATGHEGMKEIDPEKPPNPLNDTDKSVLATKDEEWKPMSWEQLQEVIANNTLEELIRSPAETRRYLAWSADIKQQYGATTEFVIKEKLRWAPDPDLTAAKDGQPVFARKSDTPFDNVLDYAILKNDWPYSFEAGIVHLLAWTKTKIETDDDKGDVTPASRQLIEDFVERKFAADLGAGGSARVLWFKNWVSLQSVRALDHVHVLVKAAPPEIIEEWLQRKDL
ncbi:hypothetical protein LTR53_000111 [Teratosphaeriaceae sp. CCFEE 6253]|nr:hypothetical protein LTR53_000111 [Teratosphaeriaceae sp. CCFEE 6253]